MESTEMVKQLEAEIKERQEELDRLKYSDVYEAQDAYRAALAARIEKFHSWKDADIIVREASNALHKAKVASGIHIPPTVSWRNVYRL